MPHPKDVILPVLQRTRMLALDFDGVLTDGCIHLHDAGGVSKSVCYLDIVGVTRWRRLGYALCIISGDSLTNIATHFARTFKIPKLYLGRMDKLAAFNEAAIEFGVELDQAIYMGDDVMDLPAMKVAALGATVPTAHPHVLEHADWISIQPAGRGAVRELIDLILTAQGHDITELRPQPTQGSSAVTVIDQSRPAVADDNHGLRTPESVGGLLAVQPAAAPDRASRGG